MNNFDIKKIRVIFIIILLLIALLELYYIIKLHIDYKGIYRVHSFAILVILQVIYWVIILFRSDKIKRVKLTVTTSVVLSVLMLLVIFVTPPRYSYYDGKEIIEHKVGVNNNYEFIAYEKGRNTIPIVNNSKRILTANKNYYYILSDGTNTRFFTVSPINGEKSEFNNDYWQQDDM